MQIAIISIVRVNDKGEYVKNLILCFLLAVITGNAHAILGFGSDNKKEKDEEVHVIIEQKSLLEAEKNTINVFENNVRSVVNISNIRHGRVRYGFFLESKEMEIPAGQGTGFVWDSKGHIVTNYHVIDGGDDFVVTFHKDKKKYKAEVVGKYPQKDIAVLKLKEMPKALYPIKIGSSSALRVGQKALAIGSPFGLDHTLTTGIISSKDRIIRGVADVNISGMIQTDCSINPGNSGGPLYNSSGQLIGMNTMIYSNSGSSSGVGFAVPVDTINTIVPQIVKHGKVKRPGLGIVPAGDYMKSRTGLDYGVIVAESTKGYGAYKAGIRGVKRSRRGGIYLGDVILKVADKPVNDLSDIFNVLEQYKIGNTVEVTYMRIKKCYELDVEEQPLEDLLANKEYFKRGCLHKTKVKLSDISSP
jgi:S1-C subfamily serine protease